MKPLVVFLSALLICGCAGTRKRGVSFSDAYDSVRVDQTVGNNVSFKVFERTILCLNARRESRMAPPLTNLSVMLITNISLTSLTNQTVTVVTNQSRTLATNQVPPPFPVLAASAATNEAAAPETNQVVVVTAPPSSTTTNLSVTTASNLTLSKAGNQTVATANYQTLLNRQITLNTNNLSITTADNQAISAETNLVVTTVTNQMIKAVTNQTVVQPEAPLRDYYLYTELTPPPDFVLQPGESLVLLVDGVRHGFSQSPSQTVFVARKGYTSTLYKVPPEVLVDISNAKQVKVRLKGNNSVIERKMSQSSRNNLKKFLLKYFVPEPPLPGRAGGSAAGGLVSQLTK